MALRWGIASAGKISNDFVCALQILPESDHKIIAVAARSLASADEFAKNHNISKAYEGYVKLAKDDEIDIVYIGALNPQHFEIAKMMCEHGKHVLCEKPLTMNEKQTRALIEISESKNVFLMEAVWSRCFPVYTELKKLLESKSVGDILQVNIDFGFDLNNIPRVRSKELGGGTILDLGVYCLQFQQLVFKGEKPANVVAVGGLNSEGTDDYTASIWTYPGNRLACMSTSGRARYPNEAVIIGTKGIIRVPQFWCPTKLITSDKTYEFELPKSDAKYNFMNSVGLSYEAEHARQCIKAGKTESPNITHTESIQLAAHMDHLRRLVGVVFPEDEKY